MSHFFYVAEGREVWIQDFKDRLTRKQYPTMRGEQMALVQPNVREYHVMGISVPDDCIRYVQHDLQPYIKNLGSSPMKQNMAMFALLMRKMLKLQPVDDFLAHDTLRGFVKAKLKDLVKKKVWHSKCPACGTELKPEEFSKPQYAENGSIPHYWVNLIPVGTRKGTYIPPSDEENDLAIMPIGIGKDLFRDGVEQI